MFLNNGQFIICVIKITPVSTADSIKLYKNGSAADTERAMGQNYSSASNQGINVSGFYIDEAAVSDYFEVYVYHTEGSSQAAESGATVFFGYKLNGVT